MEIMFATPEEAEEAFYRAFAQADLDRMMAVWADEETISCIHPLTPRIDGTEAIRASWAAIFAEGTRLDIRLTGVRRVQAALLAVHTLQENLSVPSGSPSFAPMAATNIYQLTKQGWRMISHHASPTEPPSLPAPMDSEESATLH